MYIYSVALWRYSFEGGAQFPEYVADVVADSPLLAALDLMQVHHLRRVTRAAVAAPDGIITRWENGLKLHFDGLALDYTRSGGVSNGN
jgi:hypothetical protein